MPALVGTLSLALALALAVYGATAAIVGARTGRPRVVESARTAAYSLFALVVVANLAMLAALLAERLLAAVRRVELQPRDPHVLQGARAVVRRRRLAAAVEPGPRRLPRGGGVPVPRRRPETFPWALAVMFGVSAFYLVLVLGPTTPFATLATARPTGAARYPLLQNHPLMAAHPPFLYLGYIGFTVPFAFAIAAS